VNYVSLDEQETELRLRASVSGLAEKAPDLSAVEVLSSPQRRAFVAGIVVLVIAGLLAPVDTAIAIFGLITLFYAAATVNRILLFVRSQRVDTVESVTDAEAVAIADEELPVYTILVPAYREPEVIESLIANLGKLDYPTGLLDIKLLLEGDDHDTIDALGHLDLGDHIEIVLIPPSDPRTKPKALNYGLSLARGDLVTIYDVEDQPDPLQLRRAAVALRRLDANVACLQAKLSYRNVDQNLITRWFTIEYAMWFSLFLPGLASMRVPIPLGGTSNHFRRRVLEMVGGWDPHNVTEDADLGMRLEREGYSIRILDSVTLEEANSDFVNWVRQRSRWYKGYLQTWLIHMRRPVDLWRSIGPLGFLQFNVFVGATPMLAVLNPVFWVMTVVWFIGHPHFIKATFPAPVFYLGLLCWTLGNFAIAYLTVITCRIIKQVELLWAALLVPLYWVMMSIAAAKAVWQLLLAPTFWEKTRHGLDTRSEAAVPAGEQVGVAA
jgi:cellulose synthase/poly-beta-1,6-N-acetylglucosamine synthase-like glycosyltransferase